ncbi:MAG: indole-3-glycerol phosphate synthase TrpC [Candidatus Omnitrophota bacterium]|nr:indole-3-glycerol-phosphate synthase [Candidatus Omnitrophota bacterium]MBU2528751.1 indole-3-glycerol phosphate synthase TrpC [bacterium]MBU3929135.1 indole-3-glycerol phosphate synthase TrpC [bacterium]MBU4122358.1 indole-3-glycerol phosphate synthase TrpC [bacterium]
MSDILTEIVRQRKIDVGEDMKRLPLSRMKSLIRRAAKARDFDGALSVRPYSLIAEIKRSSPSEGVIVRRFDPAKLAEIYASSGADAVSVLTENRFFGGDQDMIGEVKKSCPLPVLRKDFIFSEYQVYESRYYGADALLLIARILDKDLLRDLFDLSRRLGMTPLVELYGERDREKIKGMKIPVLGINTRDLKSGEISFAKAAALAGKVKTETLVCESGIRSRGDIDEALDAGFNSFLVGTAILKSRDKRKFIRSLTAK